METRRRWLRWICWWGRRRGLQLAGWGAGGTGIGHGAAAAATIFRVRAYNRRESGEG